jgi:hypothetical protein
MEKVEGHRNGVLHFWGNAVPFTQFLKTSIWPPSLWVTCSKRIKERHRVTKMPIRWHTAVTSCSICIHLFALKMCIVSNKVDHLRTSGIRECFDVVETLV